MAEVSRFLPIIEQLDLPRVPQQARSRQKRDAILAAAGLLFAEHGYAATTADDIAAAAEVSIGTFYSYFRNKRQVFLTLLTSCLDELGAMGIADVDYSTSPRQAVRQVVHQTLQHTRHFHGLRRAKRELMAIDDEVAAFQMQLNRWICSQIEVAVRRVAAAGLTWPDLDIPSTCWMITLLIDQLLNSDSLVADDPAEAERKREALSDLMFHALFDPSRLPQPA